MNKRLRIVLVVLVALLTICLVTPVALFEMNRADAWQREHSFFQAIHEGQRMDEIERLAQVYDMTGIGGADVDMSIAVYVAPGHLNGFFDRWSAGTRIYARLRFDESNRLQAKLAESEGRETNHERVTFHKT